MRAVLLDMDGTLFDSEKLWTISLTELARRAGLAKSTLSQLEAGTGNPSIETLWSLIAPATIMVVTVVSSSSDWTLGFVSASRSAAT